MQLKLKSPTPGGRVQGLGNQCGADDQAYTAIGTESQLETAAPCIHVRKDGAFFRLLIFPPQALPPSVARPGTHGSHASAMQAARWLSDATGWAITDLTRGG
jgi:hypothetical protein